MVKGGNLALIVIVLIIVGIGYFSQLMNGVDLNSSVLLMMNLLVLYVVLKKISLEK